VHECGDVCVLKCVAEVWK